MVNCELRLALALALALAVDLDLDLALAVKCGQDLGGLAISVMRSISNGSNGRWVFRIQLKRQHTHFSQKAWPAASLANLQLESCAIRPS